MTKTTLANRKISELIDLMGEVETAFYLSRSPRKKARLANMTERLSILQEVVRGIISA